MGIVQLANNSGGIVLSTPQYAVQAKNAWADDWESIPYLQPLSASLGAAPSVSSAELIYHYGFIKREDSHQFQYWTPRALMNAYVRILAYDHGDRATLFVGVVQDMRFDVYGSTGGEPAGNQRLTAYGMEHLLDRRSIFGGEWDTGVVADTLPKFNKRGGYGLRVLGNRSAGTGAGGYHVFSRDGYLWSAADILNYLLSRHAPEGVTYYVNDATGVLSNLYGVYSFEGLTLKQAVDKLVDRRRGLGWCIRLWGDAPVIHIFSTLDVDIACGDWVFPANGEQLSVAWDTNILVDNAGIDISQAPVYDAVVVQGRPLKAAFTASFGSGIEAGWTVGEETAYKNIGAGLSSGVEADKLRSSTAIEHVYQRFVISDDFGIAASFDDNGNFSAQFVANQGPITAPLLRSLPILAPGSTADWPEFADPAVYVSHPKDGRYYEVHNLGGADSPNASYRMLDHRPGFQLRAKLPHVFGNGSFNPDTDGVTGTPPAYDYATLVATLGIETDIRPRVVVDLGRQMETARTLVIEVYDAEFWWIAPGTVTGLSEAGELVQSLGEVARDDTGKLRAIAAMARAWYSGQRSVIRWTEHQLLSGFPLGAMIRSASSSWHMEPVNTVVTSVVYDCQATSTTIQTGWGELDFAVVLDVPGMSDFRSVGRAFNRQQTEIESLERRVGNLPIRTPTDSGSTGLVVPALVRAKLTGSGWISRDANGNDTAYVPPAVPMRGKQYTSGDAAGGNVYLVEMFDNGFGQAPVDFAQVWQMQIGPGEVIPYDTAVFSVKAGEEWFIQVPVWMQ